MRCVTCSKEDEIVGLILLDGGVQSRDGGVECETRFDLDGGTVIVFSFPLGSI